MRNASSPVLGRGLAPSSLGVLTPECSSLHLDVAHTHTEHGGASLREGPRAQHTAFPYEVLLVTLGFCRLSGPSLTVT